MKNSLTILAFLSATVWAAPLQPKQTEFARLVVKLLRQAECMGYEVTLGEAWRSEEQAAFRTKKNAEKGIGIENSLHTLRLAIDLNLFRDGKFLTATEDYRPLGEWWEALHPLARWGGRFKKPDGNHFSLEHNFIK